MANRMSEVRQGLPGWLCKRSDTAIVERDLVGVFVEESIELDDVGVLF